MRKVISCVWLFFHNIFPSCYACAPVYLLFSSPPINVKVNERNNIKCTCSCKLVIWRNHLRINEWMWWMFTNSYIHWMRCMLSHLLKVSSIHFTFHSSHSSVRRVVCVQSNQVFSSMYLVKTKDQFNNIHHHCEIIICILYVYFHIECLEYKWPDQCEGHEKRKRTKVSSRCTFDEISLLVLSVSETKVSVLSLRTMFIVDDSSHSWCSFLFFSHEIQLCQILFSGASVFSSSLTRRLDLCV